MSHFSSASTHEVQELVVEVPRPVVVEKTVEVPELEFVDVPVERVVEVPQVEEKVVVKEVFVPRIVERPVPQVHRVEVPTEVQRNIPAPVECETVYELGVATHMPAYRVVKYPVTLPRYIEVPVTEELLDDAAKDEAQRVARQVAAVVAGGNPTDLTALHQATLAAKYSSVVRDAADADLENPNLAAHINAAFSANQPTVQ